MPTTDKWTKFRAMTDGCIASNDEVVAFARDMIAADFITSVDGLQEYYEKPWHWDNEHTWWIANGRPDTWQMWDKGIGDKWEVAA